MSEIKFACPHCDQHIACDESYGGRVLQCPACLGAMRIPPVAPVASPGPLRLAASAPGVGRTPLYPTGAALDPWTEEEWNRHLVQQAASNPFHFIAGTKFGAWFWLFFLAPQVLFFLAFAFKDLGALKFLESSSNFVLNLLQLEPGIGRVEFWRTPLFFIFVVCALVSGFLLARLCSRNPITLTACGLAFAILILTLDLFVCFFGGCALGCAQAAQEGVAKPRGEVRLNL